MTIEKGVDWGRTVPRPTGLRLASSDVELAAMLADGSGRPTAATAGDVFRTIGARPLADRSELLALPFDLIDVTFDDADAIVAVAHVLVRSPWHTGGWWRGEAVAIMNAEFVGDLDIAPRGHPNDGRVESFHVGRDMGVRQRWEVRRRLPGAQHLPHPAIATRSVRSMTWEFEHARVAVVDGVARGRVRRLDVHVRPDAAVLYA